jgi:hypothetical protein
MMNLVRDDSFYAPAAEFPAHRGLADAPVYHGALETSLDIIGTNTDLYERARSVAARLLRFVKVRDLDL